MKVQGTLGYNLEAVIFLPVLTLNSPDSPRFILLKRNKRSSAVARCPITSSGCRISKYQPTEARGLGVSSQVAPFMFLSIPVFRVKIDYKDKGH